MNVSVWKLLNKLSADSFKTTKCISKDGRYSRSKQYKSGCK